MLRGEATNTNIIVFGLTLPGLEPTIYRTRGQHANPRSTALVASTLTITPPMWLGKFTKSEHKRNYHWYQPLQSNHHNLVYRDIDRYSNRSRHTELVQSHEVRDLWR